MRAWQLKLCVISGIDWSFSSLLSNMGHLGSPVILEEEIKEMSNFWRSLGDQRHLQRLRRCSRDLLRPKLLVRRFRYWPKCRNCSPLGGPFPASRPSKYTDSHRLLPEIQHAVLGTFVIPCVPRVSPNMQGLSNGLVSYLDPVDMACRSWEI
jgi:hypothetical protein